MAADVLPNAIITGLQVPPNSELKMLGPFNMDYEKVFQNALETPIMVMWCSVFLMRRPAGSNTGNIFVSGATRSSKSDPQSVLASREPRTLFL